MRLQIDQLHLRFAGATGHTHRAQPITRRALELLRWRLLAAGMPAAALNIATLTMPPVALDLRAVSDEAAAEKIAEAMYTALHARWPAG